MWVDHWGTIELNWSARWFIGVLAACAAASQPGVGACWACVVSCILGGGEWSVLACVVQQHLVPKYT